MRFSRQKSQLTIYVEEKRGRALRLSGSRRYLNRPQNFVIERYFNRWGTLYDLRLLPKFFKDAERVYLSVELTDKAREFYQSEIERRTVTLDTRVEQIGGNERKTRLLVTAAPKGEEFTKTINTIVREYTNEHYILKDPLDAFILDERVKLAGGIIEYLENFKKLFPIFMKDRLSIEPSQSFYGLIAVRHIRASLNPALRELLNDYVDAFHLLREQIKLREFLKRAREAGAKLRVHEEAEKIALQAEMMEDLMIRKGEPVNETLENTLKKGVIALPISANLYRFQQRGVVFLAYRGRALLADDMGLGKTVQAIASALVLKYYANVKHILIICPASLKLQWQKEIMRFTKESVKVVSGQAKEREFIYQSLKGNEAPTFVVINYELVYRDTKALREIDWDLLILDEAQRIKNFRTQTYSAIKSLPNKYVFALTGTPLENELYDLYNIVDFVKPGILPENPLKFRERYCEFDAFGKVRGYKNIFEVQRKISAITLRRTKEDTLSELPPIIETPIWLEMDDKQRKIYKDVKRGIRTVLTKEQWSELTLKNVMVELIRLREICDSLRIHFPEEKPSPKERELIVLLKEQVEGRARQAIVFTQWTRMAKLIAEELEDAKLPYAYLHGGTDAKEREIIVSEFRAGKYSVFLSTDAGGVGLNLQNANLVINIDLPFNPAKLDQRVSRAHRLGQAGTVNVVNLLMNGTIEENLMRILQKRKRLFHEVFSAWEEGGKPEQITLEKYLKDTRELVEELLG